MQIIHTYVNRLRGRMDDVTDMLFQTNVTKLSNLVLYIRAHLLRLIVYEALDVFVWVQDYSYAL